MRLALAVAAMLALFLQGSRSEMVAFCFAVFFFEFLSLLSRPKHILAGAIAGLAALVAISTFGGDMIDRMTGSRILALAELEHDESWSRRSDLNRFAVEQIAENPLFGKFGGHFEFSTDYSYSVGAYAHDFISSWVSFGLLGFVLYMSMTVGAFWIATRRTAANRCTVNSWNMALLTSSAVLLLVLFSKPVFEPAVALSWGFALNAARNEARLRNEFSRRSLARRPRSRRATSPVIG